MISYLEARGYIVRVEGSDNYSLSLKLYELSHTHSPVERLLKAATGPMDAMARQLGQTCILGVLHQGKVITLAQALSPTRVRLSFDLGMPYSPIHSVSGRLLLAHLPGDELASLLAGEPDYQALSEAEKADFKVKLETIWHQGYSMSRGETRMGVDDIGVLVGNPKIGVMAALTVPVFMRTQQLKDFNEILRPLQQCAQTITSATGLTVA
jgi:DNA-binding IclR family transcriptional regulator